MAAPPPYDPQFAAEAHAFKYQEEGEDIDLGIPPVSPTATVTVPTTALSAPSLTPGKIPIAAPSGVASGAAFNSAAVSGNIQTNSNTPRGFGGGSSAAAHSRFGNAARPVVLLQKHNSMDIKNERTGRKVTPGRSLKSFYLQLRDLKNVWLKLQQVLVPHGQKDILKDWDLWGPLLLCLTLAIFLSINTSGDPALVFTGIFVIVWVGSAVVTINSQLLGGKVSFFQSVCVLGYCICPLTVASIVGSFLKHHFILRSILTAVAFVWSTLASVGFLSERSLDNRRTLAVYPILLFYFAISWIVLIAV